MSLPYFSRSLWYCHTVDLPMAARYRDNANFPRGNTCRGIADDAIIVTFDTVL